MRGTREIALVAGFSLYMVLWFGGIIATALWDDPPEGTGWAAPTFLYLASTLILLRLSWRGRLIMVVIGMYGFGAEILGESTGFPFGEYGYTDTLGPALWDVPIALASAWIVVTVFALSILRRLRLPVVWWVVAGPAAMVVIDLLLEPVAVGPMDAWRWDGDGVYYGVPLVNFVGWFLVSLPIFALLAATRFNERQGTLISGSVIAFFLLIAASHALWWPILIAGLSAAAFLIWQRRTVQRRTTANAVRRMEGV